jgi:hypothetical protein
VKDVVYYVVEIKEDKSQVLHNFPCFSTESEAELWAIENQITVFQVVEFEV